MPDIKQESRREIASRIVTGMQFGPHGIVFKTTRAFRGRAEIASSLIDAIEAALQARDERAARIAEVIPETQFDLDHEPAQTEQQIRNAIAAAIRNGDTNA